MTESVVEPHRLQVHVDIDCATPAAYREVTLWWLDSLHEVFVDQPGFDLDWARRLESGWGYAPDGRPIVTGEYDEGARRRFQEVLEPGHGHFVVYGTHGGGRRPVGFVKLKCSTLGGEPTKAQVRVELGLIKTATPADVEQVEAILLALVRGFLNRWRPLFVGVSDDFEGHGKVPTDRAQGVKSRVARQESDRVLRCYSWVTYCPAHLADALGGAEALEASGVFWNVVSMPGGVLLQASEHLRDYAGEVVREVWDVLSPVLRDKPATKSPWPGERLRQRHLRVAWEDGTSGPLGPRVTREEWGRFVEEATGKRYL